MSWLTDKDQLQREAQSFDSSSCLTTKDGWFWKTIAWILFIFSFGKFKRETFLTQYATTIGHIQAYPAEWNTESVRHALPHESRHVWQARMCSLGIHPLVGLPIMGILYLFLIFPVLLAFFRAWLELDADRAAWRYFLTKGLATPEIIRTRALNFADQVSGAPYLCAIWKGLASKWFLSEANKVIANQ